MSKILEDIVNTETMPASVYKAKIKDFFPKKIYYIKTSHLQTTKHRFRTYPKPITKILGL